MTPEDFGELRDLLVKQEETPVEKVENPEKGGEPKIFKKASKIKENS